MRSPPLAILVVSIFGILSQSEESFSRNKDPGAQVGNISWYGRGFHGRKTASGERYNMHEMTCASKVLPFGTMVLVTNLENNQKLLLKVNDRGPYRRSRILDVSFAAAKKLGFLQRGHVKAEVRPVPPDYAERMREMEIVAALDISDDIVSRIEDQAGRVVHSCLKGKPRKQAPCQIFYAQQ